MQKSKTKFVHARGEKSHLKRTFLAPLTRLIILLIYKKKQAVLNPKIGCFFLQKHRFSFPKAIFNFVKITHLPDKPHLKRTIWLSHTKHANEQSGLCAPKHGGNVFHLVCRTYFIHFLIGTLARQTA